MALDRAPHDRQTHAMALERLAVQTRERLEQLGGRIAGEAHPVVAHRHRASASNGATSRVDLSACCAIADNTRRATASSLRASASAARRARPAIPPSGPRRSSRCD